jgi:hypothetical protein
MGEYHLWREPLADGELTTIYAVRHLRATTRLRVVHFPAPRRLDVWSVATRTPEAVIGGFFLRDPYRALGDVWVGGRRLDHEPVDPRFAGRRSCLLADGDDVRVGPREAMPAAPGGDLLQAGPLLVAGGEVVYTDGEDGEGFSAGAGQFDSDITDGRHPRAALGISDEVLVAVACDGRRSGVDAGLSLRELAEIMQALGVDHAINLDGGGSTTLVHRGHLLNRPYSTQDQPAPESRPIVTAVAFESVG